MAEIIDISDLNSNELGISKSDDLKSTNFGPGIELLMNDKKQKGNTSPKTTDDSNNLLDLEKELDNLTENLDSVDPSMISSNDNSNKHNVEFNLSTPQMQEVNIDLGNDTIKNSGNDQTWDGYTKFNDVPINPDKNFSTTPQLSREETLREKFNYLRKLEQLEKEGAELTKKYSMESNLTEMMGEYEMIIAEKEKQNSVKFQGNMLSALINGVEFLNGKI
jgi:hypothetical protein